MFMGIVGQAGRIGITPTTLFPVPTAKPLDWQDLVPDSIRSAIYVLRLNTMNIYIISTLYRLEMEAESYAILQGCNILLSCYISSCLLLLPPNCLSQMSLYSAI